MIIATLISAAIGYALGLSLAYRLIKEFPRWQKLLQEPIPRIGIFFALLAALGSVVGLFPALYSTNTTIGLPMVFGLALGATVGVSKKPNVGK